MTSLQNFLFVSAMIKPSQITYYRKEDYHYAHSIRRTSYQLYERTSQRKYSDHFYALPYLRRPPAGGFSKIYRCRGNCRIKSRSFSNIPSSTWERPDPPYPTAHGGNSDTWTLQIFQKDHGARNLLRIAVYFLALSLWRTVILIH